MGFGQPFFTFLLGPSEFAVLSISMSVCGTLGYLQGHLPREEVCRLRTFQYQRFSCTVGLVIASSSTEDCLRTFTVDYLSSGRGRGSPGVTAAIIRHVVA
jgi:hypothetical protein